MTVFTHAITGLGLSRFFPGESLLLPMLFSVLPDADHLLKIGTWRFEEGGFRAARTLLHELLGCALMGVAGLAVFFATPELGKLWLVCVSYHLFLDFVSGYSRPFKHIREHQPMDFGKSLRLRAIQEMAVSGVFLWVYWRF